MTIEFESTNKADFEQAVLKDPANAHLLTTEYVVYCPHADLLSHENLTDGDRKRILLHIADVIVRSGRGYGAENELTLDDIVCLTIAVYLRNKAEKAITVPLLSFIPLDNQERSEIAARFVQYQLQYIPPVAVDDPRDALYDILMCSIDPSVKRSDVMAKGYPKVTTNDFFMQRTRAFKTLEAKYLAILHAQATVDKTVEQGQDAYFFAEEKSRRWR